MKKEFREYQVFKDKLRDDLPDPPPAEPEEDEENPTKPDPDIPG